jgi:hypothetical protein
MKGDSMASLAHGRCLSSPRARALTLLLAIAGVVVAAPAEAQELEPGAYTVSPVGVSFIGLGYGFNRGDITFDPSLPVEDVTATIHGVSLAIGRALDLAGRSSTVLVSLPGISGEVAGRYRGEPTRVERTGLGDMRIRLGVNVFGAPARRLPEFVKTPEARRSVGVSLTMVTPTGEYDAARVVNLGSNRWAFKPEAAYMIHTGRWSYEFYVGVWLFTANDDFLNGGRRTQAPIVSTQAFARYTFRPGLWLSVNGNFYSGGRTTVNDATNVDLQRNSRLGGTLAVPLGRQHALRFAASRGAYTTIGADFVAVSVAFQRAWGGGL